LALLFAPSSGEELRSNIRAQADTQYARMQDEMQKGMQEMRDRMDTMRKDIDSQAESVEAGV
jgi:gas vesicle protein